MAANGGEPREVRRRHGLVALVVALWVPALWLLWWSVRDLEPVDRGSLGAAAVVLALHAISRRTPVRLVGDDASTEVPTSTMFAFAALLLLPAPVAVLGLTVTSLVPTPGGHGTPWIRMASDVGRTALTYGAAALTLRWLTDALSREAVGQGASWELMVLVLPAGLVAFLVWTAVSLWFDAAGHGVSIASLLRQDRTLVELPAHLLLVALSPAVVLITRQGMLLTPLLLLVIIALYRSSRFSAAQEHESRHDPLTGLANRRHLEARVVERIEHATLHDRVALLLLDLDRFKEVNDSFGHHVGDQLLREIGARMRSLDGVDLAARVGGDEFAFVLRGGGDEQALLRAGERLVREVVRPYVVADARLAIEASVGIAVFPEHGLDLPSLLRRADAAMYDAKRSGVPVALATARAADQAPGRVSLVAELEAAMTAGQLQLDYQPEVNVGTGEVVGVEALLRWHHPEHGLVPPSAFVGTVEHTELMSSLTRHVLRLALDDAARWAIAGVRVPISVNVSARDLQDPRLATDLAGQLEAAGFPAHDLTLEITETAVQVDPDRARRVLLELRELGIVLAIDDFGTGYSSLAALRTLPVDVLKIDRTFVAGMSDPAGAAIVRSVIRLAHALALRVVAEGVEEEADLWELRRQGCDVVQGFLLSRPLPAHLVAPWVRARRHELEEARGPFATVPAITDPDADEDGIRAV